MTIWVYQFVSLMLFNLESLLRQSASTRLFSVSFISRWKYILFKSKSFRKKWYFNLMTVKWKWMLTVLKSRRINYRALSFIKCMLSFYGPQIYFVVQPLQRISVGNCFHQKSFDKSAVHYLPSTKHWTDEAGEKTSTIAALTKDPHIFVRSWGGDHNRIIKRVKVLCFSSLKFG